ncbi:unnamed protein product [Leuciscus chuanchicus]
MSMRSCGQTPADGGIHEPTSAVFQSTKLSKVRTHLESHFNRAVLHEGYTIHRCGSLCHNQHTPRSNYKNHLHPISKSSNHHLPRSNYNNHHYPISINNNHHNPRSNYNNHHYPISINNNLPHSANHPK